MFVEKISLPRTNKKIQLKEKGFESPWITARIKKLFLKACIKNS